MQKPHKRLLTVLGSTLLGGTALAGGYQPAPQTPTPIVAPISTPAPAQSAGSEYEPIVIPALPITPTPAVPIITPAQVQTFLLTAKSGESVTLKQSTQMKMRVLDIDGTGVFATENSEAALEEMNAAFAKIGEMDMPETETVLRIGEVFADGSRELISSTMAPMPDGSEYTIKVIQRIMPDGTVLESKIVSDNADIQALFDSIDIETLTQSGGLNSSVDTTVYGMPMQVGYSKTSTQNIDMGQLLTSMMSGVMNMAAQELPEEERAEFAQTMSQMQFETEPLIMQTTTTYKGLSSAGLPTFASTAKIDDWSMNIDLPVQKNTDMNMGLELLNMTADSLSSYALNGLPVYNKSNTDMTMKMTLEMNDGDSLSFTMQVSPTIVLQAE